jgi:hypothetical protein
MSDPFEQEPMTESSYMDRVQETLIILPILLSSSGEDKGSVLCSKGE